MATGEERDQRKTEALEKIAQTLAGIEKQLDKTNDILFQIHRGGLRILGHK